MRILRVQAERLLPLLEKNYAIYWQPHKQAGRGTGDSSLQLLDLVWVYD